MNEAYLNKAKDNSLKILIGLYVWVALQTLVANYSVYYSYGLWLLSSFLMLCFTVIKVKSVITKDKNTSFIYLVGICTPYCVSIIVNSCFLSLTYFVYLVFGICFLLLKKDIQFAIIYYFVWLFSVFLFLSLIEYLLFQYLHIGFIIRNVVREQSQTYDYFYHLFSNLIDQISLLPRFQSIAEEPGLIGTLCGFLLFFTGRNKKLRTPFFLLLICGFFTFSLAFFVLMFIYYLLGSLSLKAITGFIICLTIIGAISYSYLDELILGRIDVETLEQLDNRTTYTFDYRFSQAWKKGQLWLGVGFNNLPGDVTFGLSNKEGGNAGVKKWIYQYGIISLFILFICLLKVYKKLRGATLKLYDLIFIGAFVLSFYQRSLIEASYTFIAFCSVPVGEYYREKEKRSEIKTI